MTDELAGYGKRPSMPLRPRATRWQARLVPAPALVLGSVICIQAGHAYGKLLFGLVPPMGVVSLRLAFTALVLSVLWRPRWPADWRSRGLVVGWGTAIAGMQIVYPALERLPVGAAMTVQFLGPLAVAFVGSRRLVDVVWVVLAGLGVGLFYSPGEATLSVVGTLLALASGASWAVYIVFTERLGTRSVDGSLLALAVVWAAVWSVPAGVATAGTDLVQPGALLGGLVLALVSAVVPWSLDLAALRRLSSRVFGVLVSLEPALGGLAGLLLLGEHLTLTQWLAVGGVVAASVGVTLTRTTPSAPGATSRSAGEGDEGSAARGLR